MQPFQTKMNPFMNALKQIFGPTQVTLQKVLKTPNFDFLKTFLVDFSKSS